MKFIKSQTKSAKIKKLYILSCLLIISILMLFQFTYALFINKTKDVVTNIRVGDLRYELSLKNNIVEELELPNLVVDIVDNMIPVSWDGSTLIKANKNNINNIQKLFIY